MLNGRPLELDLNRSTLYEFDSDTIALNWLYRVPTKFAQLFHDFSHECNYLETHLAVTKIL